MITRYEIAATHMETGESILIAYSPRVSRSGVLVVGHLECGSAI